VGLNAGYKQQEMEPQKIKKETVDEDPADPAPSPLSYLFLYRSLPCLTPKVLVADFSRPPNPLSFLVF